MAEKHVLVNAQCSTNSGEEILGFLVYEVRGWEFAPLTGASEPEPVIGDNLAIETARQCFREVAPEIHASKRIMEQQQRQPG